MKPRRKQPKQTREALLDAAGVEFSGHGYSGAGLGGIVARAELTKGALFHHFPDKRTLAAAWISERLGLGIEQMWVSPLGDAGSLDGFQNVCRSRCKDLHPEDATSALVAIAAEVASRDEVLADALEQVFKTWRSAVVGLLQRGQAAGWIHRSIQPELEAAFLVSALSGFTVSLKTSVGPETRNAFTRALDGYLETLRVQQG